MWWKMLLLQREVSTSTLITCDKESGTSRHLLAARGTRTVSAGNTGHDYDSVILLKVADSIAYFIDNANSLVSHDEWNIWRAKYPVVCVEIRAAVVSAAYISRDTVRWSRHTRRLQRLRCDRSHLVESRASDEGRQIRSFHTACR